MISFGFHSPYPPQQGYPKSYGVSVGLDPRLIGITHLTGEQPNRSLATTYLEKAYEQKDYIAAYLLVGIYEAEGRVEAAREAREFAAAQDYKPAVLEQRVVNGDTEAAQVLYHLLNDGCEFLSLPANPERAKQFFALTKLDMPITSTFDQVPLTSSRTKEQFYFDGKIFLDGLDGKTPNVNKAASSFAQAYKMGYQEALVELHQLFKVGQGINKDTAKFAFAYFVQNPGRALPELTLRDLSPNNEPQEVIESLKDAVLRDKKYAIQQLTLYLKIAVDNEVNGALGELADLLCAKPAAQQFLGDSETKDYLDLAARELKHVNAAFELGQLWSKTEFKWSEPFLIPSHVADLCYAMAAKGGHFEAQKMLCEHDPIYAYSVGATYFYRDPYGYDVKDGIEQDIHQAIRYFELAVSKAKDARAAYLLAEIFNHHKKWPPYYSCPIMKTTIERFGHYRKQVRQFTPQEAKQEEDKYRSLAVRWDYRPAVLEHNALEGDADAAFELFELLKKGSEEHSLHCDVEKAEKYLIKAALRWHKGAIAEYVRLRDEKKLSGESLKYNEQIEKNRQATVKQGGSEAHFLNDDEGL